MKKLCLILLVLFFAVLNTSYGQLTDSKKHKIYRSLDEALKHPLSVYKLDLSIKTKPEEKKGYETFPDEIFRLKNLQELNMSGHQINKISEKVKLLKKLRYLNLSYNSFYRGLYNLSFLKQIRVLDLSNNGLRKIPPI